MNGERDKLGPDLSAYLDDELSTARSREIQRVLADSEDARRQLDELREVSEQLGALPHLQAPADLAAVIAAQAERQLRSAPRPGARRLRIARLGAQLTAAAAVIAAGVLVGYQIMREQAVPGALAPILDKSVVRAPASTPEPTPIAQGEHREGVALAARAPELPRVESPAPESDLRYRYFASDAEADETMRVDALGKHPAEPAPQALAEVATPATTVHVVIRAQDEEQYARNVSVLAQWSAAVAPAVKDATPAVDVIEQSEERKYQILASELPARIDELLAVNAQDKVHYEASFDGDADTDALLGPVVAALKDRGVRWAGDVLKPGTPRASPRETSAGARGGGVVVGGRGRAANEERRDREGDALHRRHLAVTAEPELTIVFVPEPEPPARAAGEPKRNGGAARGLRPASEPAPAGGAPMTQPATEDTSAERLLGLSLSGPKTDELDFDGFEDVSATQPSSPVYLRVTLLPPAPPEAAASAPASQPAR